MTYDPPIKVSSVAEACLSVFDALYQRRQEFDVDVQANLEFINSELGGLMLTQVEMAAAGVDECEGDKILPEADRHARQIQILKGVDTDSMGHQGAELARELAKYCANAGEHFPDIDTRTDGRGMG